MLNFEWSSSSPLKKRYGGCIVFPVIVSGGLPNLVMLSKVRSPCFSTFERFFTFNIITFLNQQVKSFKIYNLKNKLAVLNFIS
jgi:hypothetical protein